ncbi:MAG: hypothetical protein ACM3JP_00265 [Betaproteobacteria bacterium]
MTSRLSFRVTATVVVAYALAMAYVESAVVVYLQHALNSQVGAIFPLQPVDQADGLLAIEAGREAATIVMLAAVGILAGRTWTERLAWAAVAFGAWDIGYYGWLYVFSGWPPTLATADILFLLPVPWVGPVWSPMAVSAALVGVGLVAAWMLRGGHHIGIARWHLAAGLGGGLLVIASYTLDAGRLIDGGLPGEYPWPVFAAGMLAALVAAGDSLRRGGSGESRGRAPESGMGSD